MDFWAANKSYGEKWRGNYFPTVKWKNCGVVVKCVEWRRVIKDCVLRHCPRPLAREYVIKPRWQLRFLSSIKKNLNAQREEFPLVYCPFSPILLFLWLFYILHWLDKLSSSIEKKINLEVVHSLPIISSFIFEFSLFSKFVADFVRYDMDFRLFEL